MSNSKWAETVMAPAPSTETAFIVSITWRSRSVAMIFTVPSAAASISTFDKIGMVLRRSTTDWTWLRQRSSVARSIVAFMIASCPPGRPKSPAGGYGHKSLAREALAASSKR
jgi:hypothetical protein